MLRYLGLLILIGLVVFCVIDIAGSDEDERAGLPAGAWIVIVILVPLLGSLVWLAVSRSRRAARQAPSDGWGSPVPPATGRTGRRPGPVAPDDDPEFLWNLDEQRRRAQADGDDSTPPPGATPPAG